MDTMAINSAEIGSMQSAIETYITEVETCLSNIKAFEIGPDNGFYGTAQCSSINEYITETCVQINSIVRYFDEFKEKLTEVAAAYVDQSSAITTGDVAAAPSTEGDLVTVNRMN